MYRLLVFVMAATLGGSPSLVEAQGRTFPIDDFEMVVCWDGRDERSFVVQDVGGDRVFAIDLPGVAREMVYGRRHGNAYIFQFSHGMSRLTESDLLVVLPDRELHFQCSWFGHRYTQLLRRMVEQPYISSIEFGDGLRTQGQSESAATISTDDSHEALRQRLIAALAARRAAEQFAEMSLSQAEQRAALLAQAERELAEARSRAVGSEERVALLNQQVAALQRDVAALQALLDDATERVREAQVQIEAMGSQLNAALARAAAEARRRELEEAERRRLEKERE